MTVQRTLGRSSPQRAVRAASRPGTSSAITSSGRRRPRASGSSRNYRQAAVLSPPLLPMERSTFCPSRRTPTAPSTEMVGGGCLVQPRLGDRPVQDEAYLLLYQAAMGARRTAERKTWAQRGRSGLQHAASPSVGKRAAQFCDSCDPTSCCSGLVSCGSDGAECKA